MKKTIFIISLFLLSAVCVSAQTYWDNSRPDHRFTFGVRAGGNFSKVFEDDVEWRYRLGFQIGATADVNIVRSLSIGTGVYYIQKGYKFELEYSPESIVEYDYTPSFVEIPLVLSYRIKLSDSSVFHLNGGGYYAVGLKSSDEVYFKDYSGFKSSDLGISLGAAVTYNHYYAGANYERSIRNINNMETGKAYNSSIVISLGYNF